MMKRYFPIFLFVILFASCTPEHCFEGTESYLKASFYYYKTKKMIAPDSLTMYGLGLDTAKLYNNIKELPTAMIPLNPETENVTFIIRINGVSDTMQVFYTSEYQFVSKECGFTYNHTLTSDSIRLTMHGIDSFAIKRSLMTVTNEENIRIYY